MKSYGVAIQMKPLQQYFHMVLFIENVVLTFEFVDEILWCYYSNETSSALLSHGTIYLVCCPNLSLWIKSYDVTIQMRALFNSPFTQYQYLSRCVCVNVRLSYGNTSFLV